MERKKDSEEAKGKAVGRWRARAIPSSHWISDIAGPSAHYDGPRLP